LHLLCYFAVPTRADQCDWWYLYNADENALVEEDFTGYGVNDLGLGPYYPLPGPLCKQDWEYNIKLDLDYCGDKVDRVVFKMDGPDGLKTYTERHKPYFIFANNGNSINGRRMKEGKYTVDTTVYYKKNSQEYDSHPNGVWQLDTWSFEVVDCECVMPTLAP